MRDILTSVKIAARAKVNLSLEVLGRRPDGYHEIRSAIVPLELCDDVELSVGSDGPVLSMTPCGVDLAGMCRSEDNLALRALEAMRGACGRNDRVRIGITKRIPLGAGLGGGSADAAAVLRGLNDLWGLGYGRARLAEIGASVGSDVPALVLGGAVLAEGRGERVSRIPGGDPACAVRHMVLHKPPASASTAAVYAAFRDGDRASCANELQPAAFRTVPEIAAAARRLAAAGACDVRMTGSGATVFGFAPDEATARDIADSLARSASECWTAATRTAPVPI